MYIKRELFVKKTENDDKQSLATFKKKMIKCKSRNKNKVKQKSQLTKDDENKKGSD